MQEPEEATLSVKPEGVTEGDVVNQTLYGAIRTLWEQGKSKKAIARQLGVHVQSVRKWVKQEWAPQSR